MLSCALFTGLDFSQIQRDTLHRSYIVSGLRQATLVLNTAVDKLAKVRTNVNNLPLASKTIGDIELQLRLALDPETASKV